MTIHHLNCCTMRPPFARFVHGEGTWGERGRLVAHCLLIESREGLVLVDSGIGLRDIEHPARLGGFFTSICKPTFDPAETAIRQVERLGHRAEDVRHVVLTHLDVDHAGGISDFPHAKVHVFRAEHDAAMRPRALERERYRQAHWEHGPDWVLHDVDGESLLGLEAVRAIVEPEVLLVPMIGHSRGHAAVAVKSGDGWLVHCGDAYFHKDEMAARPRCPPGLRMFQTVVAVSNEKRLHNQARLRELARAHRGEVTLFSAHDRDELAAFEAKRQGNGAPRHADAWRTPGRVS